MNPSFRILYGAGVVVCIAGLIFGIATGRPTLGILATLAGIGCFSGFAWSLRSKKQSGEARESTGLTTALFVAPGVLLSIGVLGFGVADLVSGIRETGQPRTPIITVGVMFASGGLVLLVVFIYYIRRFIHRSREVES